MFGRLQQTQASPTGSREPVRWCTRACRQNSLAKSTNSAAGSAALSGFLEKWTRETSIRRPDLFYEPDKDNHGLPFNPYKSIVVPRPIGWISTVNREGVVNLAPYSQFNNLGYDPPYVMFSANAFPG